MGFDDMNRGIEGTFDLIHVAGGIAGAICNIVGIVGMNVMKPGRQTFLTCCSCHKLAMQTRSTVVKGQQ